MRLDMLKSVPEFGERFLKQKTPLFPTACKSAFELTMKHDLEGYRPASKYGAAQNKAADADRPHNALNCLSNFPADHAGAAANDILKKVHWVVHENLH